MHKTQAEARELAEGLKDAAQATADRVEVVLAPPFTALEAVRAAIDRSGIYLSAQDVFWETQGAYTGEVSPAMLVDAGCSHVIVGHSERRQYFGETDETVNRKTLAAQEAGLQVIVCIGESLEQREAGETLDILKRQLDGGLAGVDFSKLTVAYEPIWAIGTGKTATTAQAEEAHAFIRSHLGTMKTAEAADGVRILYGGSVKPDNVDDLMAQPNVDGALVGGASLKAESFARLIRFQAV